MESDIYRPLTEIEKKEKINPDSKQETDLTPIEQSIFALLRDVLLHFKLNTVLRVAGGIFLPFR